MSSGEAIVFPYCRVGWNYLTSAATCTFVILSGSVTAPLCEPAGAFLSLSTTSMPATTSPTTVYLPLRNEASAKQMKNCELAEFGSLARAMPTTPRLNGVVREFRRQVRIFRAAGAVEVLAVAGLRHEAVHHAMERHVVVIALARELLEALGMLGREVGAQLDDDAALGGVDHQRVLRIDAGGKFRRLREGGRRADERNDDGENADHGSLLEFSWLGSEFLLQTGGDSGRHERRKRRRPCLRSAAPVWR